MGNVATKAQTNAYQKYMQKFDVFNLRFPKDKDGKSERELYINYAKEKYGLSLTSLILKLLKEDYEKNK